MKIKQYKLWLAIALSLLILNGCQNPQEDETNMDDEDHAIEGETMDNYNKNMADGQVGYVRFQKDQLDQESEKNHKIKVNREQMADMITRMILRYPGFEDAATVVTDDEILVAYQKPVNREAEVAADMVKKTAYSLVPSFYHVYVSDDPASFGDIQSLGNSTVYDEQYQHVIDQIIERMKKSPQGTTTSETVDETT
ncbi:YhcN/YlaJ family sporulation lipoprotein [Halobacillus sp. Marseille-Q1614]|uniref:YhcN/YlaJ family sporulation lipoprotein n=1 Tax=Halobacillus sp. Marseille-Q1614 TaxID=2709134 RepID=UPI0020C53AA3|nr:YhcN/YlaJ family sporulation lipoprotein [Halobacillus sp. Marseille-Q1614]